MTNFKNLFTKLACCSAFCFVSLQCAASTLLFVTIQYPPFSYELDGKQLGIAVELITVASARLHQEIKIEFVPFVRAMHMIQNGEADAIFPFAKNESRLAFAVYPTQSLIEQQPTLFVRKNSDISFDGDLHKLSHFTFGIERGANYGPEFAQAIKDGIILRTDGAEDQQHNLIKLVHGRFDIAVGPRAVVFYYAKMAGLLAEIKELQPAVGKEVIAYLAFSRIKNSQAIVDKYDDEFKKMRKDGTYDKIVRAYSE